MTITAEVVRGGQPSPGQYHGALKAVIKRGIVVLDALGDAEMRFQNIGQVWGRAIDDASMAYGYSEARVRFIPTAREIAHAEIVGDWLVWLGVNHGGVRLLVSWAHDEPIWRLAERERCSVRTIHNRIDRAVAAILKEFGSVDVDLPTIEERPDKAHLPNFMIERPVIAEAGTRSQHGKAWIDGIGFMKDGKRLRDGRDKADRIMLHAR